MGIHQNHSKRLGRKTLEWNYSIPINLFVYTIGTSVEYTSAARDIYAVHMPHSVCAQIDVLKSGDDDDNTDRIEAYWRYKMTAKYFSG